MRMPLTEKHLPMCRIETITGSLGRAALVCGTCFFLASCSTLVDEIRIRTDPNTIVKPDVDELRELELADGTYLERTSPVVAATGRGLDDLLSERPPGLYGRGRQGGGMRRRENYPENSTPIEPPATEQQSPPYPVSGAGELLPRPEAFGAAPPPEQPYLSSPVPGPPDPGLGSSLYDPSVIEQLR